MAIINCPECGKEISDQAENCPECGYLIKKSEAKNLKKYLPFIIIAVALILAAIIISVSVNSKDESKNKTSGSGYDYSYNYSSGKNGYTPDYSSKSDTTPASIFSNLKITNFSASLGKYSGRMQCEVTNNNSFAVRGYFYVNFYNSSGGLMYSQLMSLTSVSSGGKVTCSTSIPKANYPSGYSYVEFSQASLVKD